MEAWPNVKEHKFTGGPKLFDFLTCFPIFTERCPPLPYVGNTNVVFLNNTLGGVAVIECRAGTKFPDGRRRKSILCTPDGVWNDTESRACKGGKSNRRFFI